MAAAAPLRWSVEPIQLAVILLAALLYTRRVLTLRRRGRATPSWKLACFGGGLAVALIAFVSPIDVIGEERLFFIHMLQHVLLGDVAPLLVVLGLDGPLLRPLLALPGVMRLRVFAHPLLALPLWAASLGAWHVPALYDAALAHPALHALQHGCFFVFGAFVWAAIVEPLPGPRWFGAWRKAVYLGLMWFFSLALSSVFLWYDHPLYPPYIDALRTWGIGPLADQRLGGGVMLVEGSSVMLAALVWLLLRVFAETEARQQLLEAGLEPAAAARAARYGRA